MFRENIDGDNSNGAGMNGYASFVQAKSQLGGKHGFKASFQHPMAYDFQSHLVDWAIEQGRGAVFADCGLGKTLMQMTWAHNVNVETNRPVLIIAPLMVSLQTLDEAEKFGFEAERSLDGKFKTRAIVTTNYERLHHFDPADFAGVVCDESSIMKNFDGAHKASITEFMRLAKYRLLCSATPSPNDYVELGTSSEALGQIGYMDMLSMFFKNDEDSLHPMSMGSQWRFKTHAQRDFWRWVCSWARACRKPSDLGYDDRDFILPALVENEHLIESPPPEGHMFAVPALNLADERAERRATIEARCGRAAELLIPSANGIAWCHLNAEADMLKSMIAGSEQISGADKDERKEELFQAFRKGELKHLITKPKIAAFGLNFQHCNHMTYFADHSFEQYYQAVRRMWRFGQKRAVTVDMITTESLAGVTKNLRRKTLAAEEMFRVMINEMNDALALKRFHEHTTNMGVPSWL